MGDNRSKIIETATHHFIEDGYENTSVNKIINEIGIAKGTFYHYFSSKEELMHEIITLVIKDDVAKAQKIMDDNSLNGFEKFKEIIKTQNKPDNSIRRKMIEEIHVLRDYHFHQESIKLAIIALGPIIAQAIEQGNEEKIFNCANPLETVKILIGTSNTIFDANFPIESREELLRLATTFIKMAESAIGCKEGMLDFMLESVEIY